MSSEKYTRSWKRKKRIQSEEEMIVRRLSEVRRKSQKNKKRFNQKNCRRD